MGSSYDSDIVAWAEEQAAMLRRGEWAGLDLQHLAEEIEDVGKSEQRELASRMSILVAHLLEWQCQPARRGASWRRTIREQRRAIAARLADTPSLNRSLANPNWLIGVWADAVAKAVEETGIDAFPEHCPWPVSDILAPAFYPET